MPKGVGGAPLCLPLTAREIEIDNGGRLAQKLRIEGKWRPVLARFLL